MTAHTNQTEAPDRLAALKLLLVLLAGLALVALAHLISHTPFSGDNAKNVPGRWGALIAGMIVVLAVYAATARNPVWRIGLRQIVYGLVGVALYTVLLWVSNNVSIFVPSSSQVVLRPAIAVPILFGAAGGPVAGLFTGLAGNVLGDLISPFPGVSPQWDMGNGLIGFVSGLALLVPAARRQRATWYVLGAAVALTVLVTILFMFNQSTPNQFIFADTPIAVSTLLGFTPIIGVALVIAAYVLTVLFDPDAAVTVAWGGLGNLIGIGFAALADILVDKYTVADALVGEFIPAAGPNMIVLALLVPVVYVLFRLAVRRSVEPARV
jgi:hypothetical protein